MFCKKCGKQVKDGISFCPYCGQKITIPPSLRQEDTVPVKAQKTEDGTRKSESDRRAVKETSPESGVSKSLIPAVVIVILLAVVAVLVFMLYSNQPKDKEAESYQGYQETAGDLNGDGEDGSDMPVAGDEAAQEEADEEINAEQEAVQEEAGQYVLPESDSVYLTMSDLEGLTKEECRIARNELYARHGRRFDDEGLQGYFDSCGWYEGTIAPADFDDSVLNEYEMANRDLIVRYEEEQGYR